MQMHYFRLTDSHFMHHICVDRQAMVLPGCSHDASSHVWLCSILPEVYSNILVCASVELDEGLIAISVALVLRFECRP